MARMRILIGSLSGPNFALWTAKMDRSRTDFTYLCFLKDFAEENLFAVK